MINIKNHLKRLKPKAGNTIFISVDGHGGSGKSTFAKYLSELLEAELIERNCGGGRVYPVESTAEKSHNPKIWRASCSGRQIT